MVQRQVIIVSIFLLVALQTFTARGEGGRRVLCWAAEGASDEALTSARERLSRLGEVVAPPPAAPAGDPSQVMRHRAEVSATIERARAFYYEGDLTEATTILSNLLEEEGSPLAAEGSIETLRSAMLWLGASLSKDGRADEAMAPFTQAVRLGLDEVDRSLFPPEVTAAFDAARQQVLLAPRVRVTFEVLPQGASVEVDGHELAEAESGPAAQELGRGGHVVVVQRAGYLPAAVLFSVGEQPETIELSLSPASNEQLAAQVSVLIRDGALDPSEPSHVALLAQALRADYVGVVSSAPETSVELYDGAGHIVSWPAEGPSSEMDQEDSSSGAVDDDRPTWRRWWFWFALIGGTAVAATGVGLGVYYGTQNRDTFTLVVEQ